GLVIVVLGTFTKLNYRQDLFQVISAVEVKRVQIAIKQLEKSLKNEVEVLKSDESKGVNDLINGDDSFTTKFITKNGRLKEWSNSNFYLPNSIRGNKDISLASFENNQGVFLVRKATIRRGVKLITLICLERKYPIVNEFLQSNKDNGWINKFGAHVNLNFESSVVSTTEGTPLFSLSRGSGISSYGLDYFSDLGMILGYLILLLGVLDLCYKVYINEVPLKEAWLIVLIISTVRILSMSIPNYSSLWSIEAFDSTLFASSWFLPSYGDYILNMLYLGAALWLIYHTTDSISQRVVYYLLPTAGVVLFLFYKGISVLYKDSHWNFDVSSSLDLSLNQFLYIIITLILSIGLMVWFLWFRKLLVIANLTNRIALIVFGLQALVLVFFFELPLLVVFSFFVFLWFISKYIIGGELYGYNFKSYLYFVSVAIFVAISGSTSLLDSSLEKLKANKERFAMRLLDNSDLEVEYLLGEVRKELSSDPIIVETLPNIWTSKDAIVERINERYLGREFDKYEADILLFDRFGNGYYKNSISNSYFDLIRIYNQKKYKTSSPELMHVTTYSGVLQDRYIQFVPVKEGNRKLGYIVISLVQKSINVNSLYPLLVNNYETKKQLILSGFNYSIYEDGNLVLSKGNFPYQESLNKKASSFTSFEGYYHYVSDLYKGRQVVISSPDRSLTVFFSNFSFLFIIQVFVVFIYLVAGAFLNRSSLSKFSTKIQIYLNIACFTPLIVVSVTTVGMLNTNYKNELNDRFVLRAQSAVQNIDEHVERFANRNIAIEELQSIIDRVSEYSRTDINLYSSKGKLLGSSQRPLFNLGLLSGLINPIAKKELKTQNNLVLLEEKIGGFDYSSVYLNVVSPTTGEKLGFISIPFFNSEKELNEKRLVILGMYMNVFAIAFILIMILSQLAFQSINRPLK
ncbi:MAG: hypothetical protein MK212_20305, partial [Saprospiraceae bacterium]|nr:hypothetical protein [Saprospiraceae bacterium]